MPVSVRLLMLVIAMAALAYSRRLARSLRKSSPWVANPTPAEGAFLGVLLFVSCALPVMTSEFTSPAPPYRAFSDASYWNTRLPASAPIDPDSRAIVNFLKRNNGYNFVRLAGTDSTGKWGNPIYWSGQDDPEYHVVNTCNYPQPPEFHDVRIPTGAKPDPTSDAAMTIYDVDRGLVYAMHWSSYDAELDTWSACGGTVYYLGSNGLHGKLHLSDEPRNTGHRGVPPPMYAVRFDEIEWGSIDHVLKIAVHAASSDHVFPMVGSDGVSAKPSAPPEGARLRIKPKIDLKKLDLSPPALVIARTLQRYGAVIGDQSAGNVNLKVENTIAEGRGHLWDGVLDANSLSAIRLRDYKVVRHGYKPKGSVLVGASNAPPYASSSGVLMRRVSREGPNPEPAPSLAFRRVTAAGVSPADRATVSVGRAHGFNRPRIVVRVPAGSHPPYTVGRPRSP